MHRTCGTKTIPEQSPSFHQNLDEPRVSHLGTALGYHSRCLIVPSETIKGLSSKGLLDINTHTTPLFASAA